MSDLAAALIGLDRVSLHSFRRSQATHLHLAGGAAADNSADHRARDAIGVGAVSGCRRPGGGE